jgi:hypothetical protein
MQAELGSKYLNSYDCFLIEGGPDEKFFIWRGKGSKDAEFEVAQKMVQGADNLVVLNEGEETDEFWDFLGGKEDYCHVTENMDAVINFEPRLFNISNRTGYTYMTEIP